MQPNPASYDGVRQAMQAVAMQAEVMQAGQQAEVMQASNAGRAAGRGLAAPLLAAVSHKHICTAWLAAAHPVRQSSLSMNVIAKATTEVGSVS